MAYSIALATFLLTTSFYFSTTEGAKSWMNQPYDDESEFNFDVQYLHNVTITCTDIFVNETTISPMYWIRPDTTVMMPGDQEDFPTAKDGPGFWRVTPDGDMVITNVQEQHFGFYYCVGNTSSAGDLHVVKKAVNFEGPYFGGLWDMYRTNTIIGCSAAGGFLILCIICYVSYYVFIDSKEELGMLEEKAPQLEDALPGVASNLGSGGHYETLHTEL